MCEYSERIFNGGKEEGLREGRQAGLHEGRQMMLAQMRAQGVDAGIIESNLENIAERQTVSR